MGAHVPRCIAHRAVTTAAAPVVPTVVCRAQDLADATLLVTLAHDSVVATCPTPTPLTANGPRVFTCTIWFGLVWFGLVWRQAFNTRASRPLEWREEQARAHPGLASCSL